MMVPCIIQFSELSTHRSLYTKQSLGKKKETESEVKHAQAYIFHACMHTNTHLWASLQEGAEASQPERRQGNVVSDHLIGLAPDRQRSLRQPVRGPKLTLQSHFGSGWLRAERLRKTANPEPQSFCPVTAGHYLTIHWQFSQHSHTQEHTRQGRQTGRRTKINPLDLCRCCHLFTHLVQQLSLIGDIDA